MKKLILLLVLPLFSIENINAQDVFNEDMNLLSIECNNGSKIFISIKPIPTNIRSYLNTAIEGRMHEKRKDAV